MKPSFTLTVMSLLVLGSASLAFAHDPSEHEKEMPKADCSKMKEMDHSKMDMKDPVVQAMMKQCHAESQKVSEMEEKPLEPEKKKAKKKHDHNQEK